MLPADLDDKNHSIEVYNGDNWVLAEKRLHRNMNLTKDPTSNA
jgi:hypothetical protein